MRRTSSSFSTYFVRASSFDVPSTDFHASLPPSYQRMFPDGFAAPGGVGKLGETIRGSHRATTRRTISPCLRNQASPDATCSRRRRWLPDPISQRRRPATASAGAARQAHRTLLVILVELPRSRNRREHDTGRGRETMATTTHEQLVVLGRLHGAVLGQTLDDLDSFLKLGL